jgi:thiol-disulfide isomerase/thioredoxin
MPRGIALPSLARQWRALAIIFAACLAWGAIANQAARAAEEKPAAHPAATVAPPARFLFALDLEGRAHNIGDGDGYRAVALVFLGTECPLSREYVPTLNRLAAAQAGQPVKFYGVISDASVSRAAALKFQQEFKVEFPVLFDASGEIGDLLAPTHVPEAFVLDANGAVKYRGRINDLYGEPGKKRPQPTTHEFADAIAAVAADKPVEVAQTTPVGCPVEGKHGNEEPPTFNRDIAPILFARCSECHRHGEVAPFALLSHADAAKRAEFLAQTARGGKMPPWTAELGHGDFLGERHLTERQISLLEAWAKAGAPEGPAADLPPPPQFASGWRLGKPNLELQAPAPFTVAADGPDIFQHFIIPLNLDEDKTIVGFEFRPGNAAVVHHAILFLDTMGVGRKRDAETPEPGYRTSGSIGIPVAGIVGVWTPGMTPRFFPQDIGLPVRKGADLVLQLHVHPSGKEETDQSSIALYFADKPTQRKMAGAPLVLGSLMIDIPAGSRDYSVESSVTLPIDVTLISLLPHMHLVGKEMKLTATLPDGDVKSLVWIKDWNFYWQNSYMYREPVRLPAGTRLDIASRYDNSEQNPLNPSSPPQRVLFGNGSTDEMCFGIFQVLAENRSDEQKIGMVLMQSAFKQWNESTIDAEGRKYILDEAGKLFGTDGATLNSLLNSGRRLPLRPARKADDKPAENASPKAIVVPG